MTKTSPASIIRPYRDEDWSSLWPIIRDIVAAGETYVYDRDMSEAGVRAIWLVQTEGAVAVAEAADGQVLGSSKTGPNQAGPGAHVATASFMVGSAHRGHGTGEALARHVLEWAAARGFRAMQFNAVVETNTRAVLLCAAWDSQSWGRRLTPSIIRGTGLSASISCTGSWRRTQPSRKFAARP